MKTTLQWIVFAFGCGFILLVVIAGGSYLLAANSPTVELYSTGEPAELVYVDIEEKKLGIQTNPLDFSMSPNCHMIISALDKRIPEITITDLASEPIRSKTFSITELFGEDAEEVYHLMLPTIGPDNKAFAVVGIMPGSRYLLFFMNEKGERRVISRWVDETPTEIKWLNESTVVVKSTDGLNRPFTYESASLDGTEVVSEEQFQPLRSHVNAIQQKYRFAHRTIVCGDPITIKLGGD